MSVVYSEMLPSQENSVDFDSFLENDLGLNLESSLLLDTSYFSNPQLNLSIENPNLSESFSASHPFNIEPNLSNYPLPLTSSFTSISEIVQISSLEKVSTPFNSLLEPLDTNNSVSILSNSVTPSYLSQPKVSIDRHSLLPLLPFKSYEEFQLYKLKRQQCHLNSIHSYNSNLGLLIKNPHELYPSSEVSHTSIVLKTSLKKGFNEPIFISHINSSSTSLPEGSITNYNSQSLCPDSPLEKLSNGVQTSLATTQSLSQLNLQPPSNHSEGTLSSSEASPFSENILTDSILNLFQLEKNSGGKVLQSAKIKNVFDKDPNSFMEVYNQEKISSTCSIPLPPNNPSLHIPGIQSSMPPSYSISDVFTSKSSKPNSKTSDSPASSKISSQSQNFLNRLDEIIQIQQHCIGLLKEIRDKFPFSEPSIFMTGNPPVPSQLLENIQQLQQQLYMGLNESNLQSISRETVNFSN